MKNLKLVKSLFIIIIALALVKVIFSNLLSSTGVSLSQCDEQIRDYSSENSLLSKEIMRYSSLAYLSAKATNLGFQKPSLVVNFTSQYPIALK
jgi:hypothetical protein